MAEQDRINLVDELTKLQKENKYIILTTYCFDPVFFDDFLLGKLIQNNEFADIVVMVDASQYKKSVGRFTEATGTKYHLLPIYMSAGVFHPKIFLFLSDKKLTLYIGSANLTLQGLTTNAELVSKFEYSLNNKHADFRKILEILDALVNKNFIKEKKVIKILNEIKEILSREASDAAEENPNYAILHNLERPILYQIIDELKDETFEEILVLAPFFSKEPKMFAEIFKHINAKRFTLALQRNNHNITDLSKYKELMMQKNISFEIKEASFEDGRFKRFFHSKLLFFDGAQYYFLVGSPNLTDSAMLKTAEHGNFECAVFYKGIDPSEILKEINLSNAKDLNSLLVEFKDFTFDNLADNLLRIYSIDFDEVNKTLNVETEKMGGVASIKLRLDSGTILERGVSLNEGRFTISDLESIPKEITITCGNKSFTRRIFYDKRRFYKRIAKSSSPKEIVDHLQKDLSLDFDDIIGILSGISEWLSEQSNAGKMQQERAGKPKVASSKIYKPSRVRTFSGFDPFLKNLQRLYETLNVRTEDFEVLEESFPDEVSEKELKKQFAHALPQSDIKKYYKRSIDRLNKKLLLFSTALTSGKNEYSALVEFQIFFIRTYLTFFRKMPDSEILDYFLEKLEKNLENIDKNSCSKEDLLKLFDWILLLNYHYDYHERYYFDRDLFDLSDLIDKETYYEAKHFVKQIVDKNFSEYTFNKERFLEHYSRLVAFVCGSGSLAENIRRIGEKIKTETEEELARMYEAVLKKLLYGDIYSPRGYEEILNNMLDIIRRILEAKDVKEESI